MASKVKIIQATYRGDSGKYYQNGERYELRILSLNRNKISKLDGSASRAYGSIYEFLIDWNEITSAYPINIK